jgi:hypothetical protein
MRLLTTAAVIVVGAVLSTSSLADQYPVTGVWASFDASRPKLTDESCASYGRDPNRVVGNVIVFQGTKKVEFNGGYLEEETVTNLSVQKIGPNEFRITDRYYDDGEAGSKPGYKKRIYRLIVGDGTLSITEGKYPPSQYLRCPASALAAGRSSNTVNSQAPSSTRAPVAGYQATTNDAAMTAPRASSDPNQPITWPLGPLNKAADASLAKIIERIRSSTGKHDLLGLSPGMTYVEALRIMQRMKDIARSDGRCEVFAFPPEAIVEFARRGQSLSCAVTEGRLTVYFSPNFPTRPISSVVLDFPSGATALEMIQNVTDRYGGTPKDLSKVLDCEPFRSQRNNNYQKCLTENKQREHRLLIWELPNGIRVTLERQTRYYDQTSNAGFTITIGSPQMEDVNKNAVRQNLRNLNAEPHLTSSRRDLIGISPGMTYDQIIQTIISHGYYIRPLSQAPTLDAFGRVLPYCSDPDEISNRRGTRLSCTQNEEQRFELEFEFTAALNPPVLLSVQLAFESGLDEMIAYVADQFGAIPTKAAGYEIGRTVEWSIDENLKLQVQQNERRKWTLVLSSLAISEADKRAASDAERTRNIRPKF